MNFDKHKFPVGHFVKPEIIEKSHISSWLKVLENFPGHLIDETNNLADEALDMSYRSEGWTIRQIVHHLADSHLNSFIRLKLSLTEVDPIVKPYFEERWAELEDSKNMSIAPSLKIIEGVHQRWVGLLKTLSRVDMKRTFFHPEHQKLFSIEENIGVYAWHSEHHLAHIKLAKNSL